MLFELRFLDGRRVLVNLDAIDYIELGVPKPALVLRGGQRFEVSKVQIDKIISGGLGPVSA